MAGTDRRARLPLSAALLGALSLTLILLVFPYQIDDAFIVYRYARNAVEGHGLRFNVGAERTEGVTSPLWFALVSLFALVRSSAVATLTSLAGAAFGAASAAVLLRFDGAARGRVGLLGCALFALSPAITFHSATGLETPLWLLLILLSHGAAGLGDRARRSALFLAAWTRPEAPLLFASLSLLRAIERGPRSLLTRAHMLDAAALLAGLTTALAARFAVYRTLVPNTALAKSPSLEAGLRYAREALTTPWFMVLAVAAVFAAVFAGRRAIGLLASAALWFVAAVLEGGDWMPCLRLLCPCAALLALGAAELSPSERSLPKERRALWWTLIVVGSAAALYGSLTQLTRVLLTQNTILRDNALLYDRVRALRVRSIALVDIGALGYTLPEVSLFDLGGLTDRTIASAPGGLLRKRFDRDYLFVTRRPEAVLLRVNDGGEAAVRRGSLIAEVERYVFDDPRFGSEYVQWLSVLPNGPRRPYYGRVLFLRADLARTRVAPSPSALRLAPAPRD